MHAYHLPQVTPPPAAPPRTAILVAPGDLRQHRNRTTWQTQAAFEQALTGAFEQSGWRLQRAHAYQEEFGHGYIWNQRMGMDVFQGIDPNAPLVVAITVWQYSHHVLAGLRSHRGPILTVANWSGQWPGLVGLLNLNACLVKMGVPYSSLWTEDCTDDYFLEHLDEWLQTGCTAHDTSHVHPVAMEGLPGPEAALGRALADQLKREKAVIGVFDEGCMGMYNAVIDDELLNPCGIYKERLSQSALLAEMQRTPDDQAQAVYQWLLGRGMRFDYGDDPARCLTPEQVLEQCRMYLAAGRIADDFGCAAIGIQYQQGLKDMAPASDLAEGLFNNPDRPPIPDRAGRRELYPGQALPHFNEVDEGAALDMLATNRVWQAMGLDPACTVHDVRWGDWFEGQFMWVFMISGAVPASHLIDGYAGAVSQRQPPPGFPSGGGTIKGVCKPGQIIWSRVFIEDGRLQADLGCGHVVELPPEETERRWQHTTPVWPILHAVLHGVSRDQMMARHRANHVVVAYAPDEQAAGRALSAKAAMLLALGIRAHFCGETAA
jgi:hypothetical protein